MYPQGSKLGAYLPKYIWAELWGPVPCVWFRFPSPTTHEALPLARLWRSRVVNMASIRAGAAKLVCQKSWGQGCSEQHGSWSPLSVRSSHPCIFSEKCPLSQGCRKLWVVLKGSCSQLDIFPDRPLSHLHRGRSSVAGINFVFCLSFCSMPGSLVPDMGPIDLTVCPAFVCGWDTHQHTWLVSSPMQAGGTSSNDCGVLFHVSCLRFLILEQQICVVITWFCVFVMVVFRIVYQNLPFITVSYWKIHICCIS